MTRRQWMTTLGLLALVVLAAVALVLTRGSAEPEVTKGRRAPLVDEQPLRTARSLAPLASDTQEKRFAQQAEKLADHEVDLAFADGLRDAAEHPVTPTAETRELLTRENKADAAIKADQSRIEQLKKDVAAASGARHDSLQQELSFALVQLELDQDELEDIKGDLLSSGSDPLSRIQRQFNRHEANEHALETGPQQSAASNPDSNYLARTLWRQFAAWRFLRQKRISLEHAFAEATNDAAILTQKHNVMEKQTTGETAGKLPAAAQAGGKLESGPASPETAKRLASAVVADQSMSAALHLSAVQKDLADLNKRVQDHQGMSDAYSSWIARVTSHERTTVHGMAQSALLILLILLAVYVVDRLVDHFLTDVRQERTRLLTLRVVIHFVVRSIGLLLILLVILGAPNQMPAILGLVGAGLTLALKDFIVAFVGWFVLMGRNGIRVGDWVEIEGVTGEVVEINLFRTVLLETGNWADTGHPTGRKVVFANSFAISGHYFNFSTSGQWLWDEIETMVPSDRDPYPLIDAIQKMVAHETEASAQAAEAEWKRSAQGHHVRSVSAAPAINLRPTSAGVEVHVRYITQAHERYATRTRLFQALVQLLHGKHTEQGADKAQHLPAASS